MKAIRLVCAVVVAFISCFLRPVLAQLPSSNSGTSTHSCKPAFHRSFENAEAWAKKFDDPARDKWQKPDEVIQALKIAPADKIADIGAGTGYFSLRIAEAHPDVSVIAADIEPGMIEYLKTQAEKKSLRNHEAVKVAADKPDLPEAVNVVLIADTYHHIDNRVAYLQALKRVLLPNARVVIIDFTADSPEGPPPEYRLSKADVGEEMKKAGYSLIEDVQLLPYQYFLVFTPVKD